MPVITTCSVALPLSSLGEALVSVPTIVIGTAAIVFLLLSIVVGFWFFIEINPSPARLALMPSKLRR
jgi:hypothetical protein